MKYVLLGVEDDMEAWQLAEDAAGYPGKPILTPSQENPVHATVLSVRDDLGGDEPAQPETVCLCGSMRFYPLMLQVASHETQQGRIVLAPFVTVEPDEQDSASKKALDDLHRAKLRMSQRVIVVSDETGYYGESTRREIEYARSLGLPVDFQVVDRPDEPLPNRLTIPTDAVPDAAEWRPLIEDDR